MPANCQLLFGVLIKIATFDIIPVDGIMDYIDRVIQATYDAESVGENFHEFEYESSDPIQNL